MSRDDLLQALCGRPLSDAELRLGEEALRADVESVEALVAAERAWVALSDPLPPEPVAAY